MRKPPLRMYLIAGALLLCMTGMMWQLLRIVRGDEVAEVGIRQGRYHLNIPLTTGMIYDREMIPLNNRREQILAVVSPTPETIASVFSKLRDSEKVAESLKQASPFVCELTEEAAETPNLRILHGRENLAGHLPAQHLLGYRQNGAAMSGLERAYASWLQACDTSADVTFTVSALGEVLAGADQSLILNGQAGGGIVTTLSAAIQQITETALETAAPHPAAAIVLDCATGDILACASSPVYDPQNLAASMDDPQSPFLNRALSAYSVGSVFKLVIAATALERGLSTSYMYECTGATDVYGQCFRCHKWDGHGLLNLEDALIQSCNPYFINLGQLLPADALYETAERLGFGTEIQLAPEIMSHAGVLPDAAALQVSAEKANFCFGQGQLLATPMQVAAMTACIANDGVYPVPRLVVGLTEDGQTLCARNEATQHPVLSRETAMRLQQMMTGVLEKSEQTNGRPSNTTAGGKTSTAQTGRYDADGKELCHAWMTGFFPSSQPRYAVTVFVEDGGSGNQAAAPIFRQIIESIVESGL